MAKSSLSILWCILLIPFGQASAETPANVVPVTNPVTAEVQASNPNPTAASQNPEFPEISPEDKLAREYVLKGDAKAIAMYQQNIAKNGQDRIAYLGLIDAAIEQKNYMLASEQLNVYKNKFGDDDRSQMLQAKLALKSGKTQQGLSLLSGLLQKDPASDALLDLQASVMSQLGRVATSSHPPKTAPTVTPAPAAQPTPAVQPVKVAQPAAPQQPAPAAPQPEVVAVINSANTPVVKAKPKMKAKTLVKAKTQPKTFKTVYKPVTTVARQSTPVVVAKHAPIAPIATTAIERTHQLTNSYVEAGVEGDTVTHDNGNWSNQYVKGFFQVDPDNAWYGELYHDNEFHEYGDYLKVEQTHNFNEDYYMAVSAGISDNSFFIPKYSLSATIFRILLDSKQLVAYLGVHAYWWRPDSSSEDINPGVVYYFEQPWIVEVGAYFNRSHPGNIFSKSMYVAVTEGREKEHFITLRYGFGNEAYLPLGNGVAVVNYPSYVFTLTWRQWIGQNWGTNIIAEDYHNSFYNRMGLTLGLFKDFAI